MKKLPSLCVYLLIFLSGCGATQRPEQQLTDRLTRTTATVMQTTAPPVVPQIFTELPSLSLQECIKIALANNHELAATKRDVDVSTYQRDSAKAALWPKVSLIGSYAHTMDESRLAQATYNGESGVFSKDIAGGEVAVSFPIYTGGRITSGISAADFFLKASEHKQSFTRDELVFNVSAIYYSIIAQHHVTESLQFSSRVLKEERKRITQLINTQKSAQIDLLKADVRIADIEQKLTVEKNILALAQRGLANMMNVDEIDLSHIVLSELQVPVKQLDLSQFTVSQALKNRQDYLAALAAYEAQEMKVSGAKSGYYPTVSVRGAYGRKYALEPTRDEKWAANSDTSAEYASVGLVLDIPIFEGGLTSARVNEETAKLSALRLRLQKFEKQIQLDMEAALLNLESARSRIDLSSVSMSQAKENLRIERMKYEVGKGIFTDILDAQAMLLQAQVSYYRALAEFHTAHAKLQFMTGGVS